MRCMPALHTVVPSRTEVCLVGVGLLGNDGRRGGKDESEEGEGG